MYFVILLLIPSTKGAELETVTDDLASETVLEFMNGRIDSSCQSNNISNVEESMINTYRR